MTLPAPGKGRKERSREAVSLKKWKSPLFNVLEVEGYAENLQLITQNWNFSIYTEYYAEFYKNTTQNDLQNTTQYLTQNIM